MAAWLDDLARAMARDTSRKAFIKSVGAAIVGIFVAGPGAAEAKKGGSSGGKVKGCRPACTGGQVCQAGQCACPAGQTLCAGACVDLSADNSQCGACGHACPGGQTCQSGQCVGGGGTTCGGRTCADGESCCGNQCVPTQTDSANCGGCGKACTAGQTCRGGACGGRVCRPGQITCPNGCCEADSPVCCPNGCCDNEFPVCCGSICCPPDTHCGPNETCVPGGCPTGQANCDGACTNLQTDSRNCGACGRVCPIERACKSGQCGPSAGCGDPICFDCAGSTPFVDPPPAAALRLRELAAAIPVTVDDFTVLGASPLCEPSGNAQLRAVQQLLDDADRAEATGDTGRASQLRAQARTQLAQILEALLGGSGRPSKQSPASGRVARRFGPGAGLRPPDAVFDLLAAARAAGQLKDQADLDRALGGARDAYSRWAAQEIKDLGATADLGAIPDAIRAMLQIGRDGAKLGLPEVEQKAVDAAQQLAHLGAIIAASLCPPSLDDVTKVTNLVHAGTMLGDDSGTEDILKPTVERYVRQQVQGLNASDGRLLKLAELAGKFGLKELRDQILTSPTRVEPPDCLPQRFNCECNGQVYDSRSQCLNECHVNLKCFASCICCPIKS